MLSFQVKDYKGKLWVDGSPVDFNGSRAGNFTFYDYSREWRADLQSAFDCVNLHIPRSALTFVQDEIGVKRIADFIIAPGSDVDDPVIAGIIGATLPVFDGTYETNKMLLDYIGTSLLVHLVSHYSSATPKTPLLRGGLTPRQLSQATELINANLRGTLSLAEIAQTCGLSSTYFARAFKVSTGLTPHRWLANRRIDMAVDLMKSSTIPLSEVAIKCGYADQAHFTRSFSESKGMPPSAWRRERQRSLFNLHRAP
ncbi:helix-turn-helix domain-containing protein [Aliirhizobium cellulosilyticum]|uniref:AraC-like DNA-binding protein n=1 Tax=Aliirhizobium cellulosilyticum TaxID=393664 RepID=A0A7W6TF98_9HYPH|nr:AraC family transcriptional regulator [Rhizobium cellulosilyticum]MBB4349352.1 AraC-like DNA-binding protein [Rhizobium cellulosilyticum]MBB4412426.1 AraC-like DNA-binding protein [Rhizobium cellulosilyticum]MBB4447058.1 AraC-like DNA-binding protein [Rhizobium cellulosilyticum]